MASQGTSSSSPLISFVLTPAELRAVQGRLGLASSSSSRSSPPRPPQADTTTSSLKSASFWLQDANLPKTTRTASRAAGLVVVLLALLRGVGQGVRERSPTIALRRTLESTTKSLRLFLSIFTYSTLYRSALHALLLLRSRILADSTSYAPRTVHREEGSSSSNRATLTHRTRIYARLLRVLRSSATLPLLSALLASPALLALLPPDAIPSASLGLWLISQSSSTAYTRARERGSRLVSWVPSWANSSLLYALGNGQLLWAFLFESTTFPQGYRNVILARSGTYIQPRPSHLPAGVDWPSKATISDHVALLATPSGTAKPFPSFTSPLLSSLGEKASRHPTTPYGAINPILDYSPAHPAHTRLMCAMLHPREPSCRTTLWNHFRAEWPASARFAGLFALLSSLLFRAKSWKRDPERQLFKLFSATLQGASVISGSIGTSWALICFFQHYLPATFLPRSRFFLNGFLSSLIWIKVVPRERRRELGLYTGRMSVQSTWDILERRGMVKGVKRGDVLVLAVGLGMLAALYEGGQGERGGAGAIAKRLFGERIQGVGEEGEERRGE